MKITAKFLLVGFAIAGTIALSAAPSEAAKKRAHAKCDPARACSANCQGNTCEIRRCDPDGKTHVQLAFPTCAKGACPPAC